MKNLQDILYGVRLTTLEGQSNRSISKIEFDSRKIEKGDLFVAIKGELSDGHEFIEKAIESGAVAVLCEEMPENRKDITYVQTTCTKQALAIVAANYYDHPSEKIHLIGVTGTNGKTSVSTLLYRLFTQLGNACGLISTVHNIVDGNIIESTHTTPDPLSINALLSSMLDKSCTHCFMEVSSHALMQERTYGLQFNGAVFTNISHDHLDYHGTFDAYIKAKKRLFDQLPKGSFAVYNDDDKRGSVMVQNTKADVYSLSVQKLGDFKAKILENSFDGLVLNIQEQELHTSLIGSFNAYNILSVFAVATLLGEDPQEVLAALSMLKSAEGRFDYFLSTDKVVAIVDYAHTPDALKQVLSTIKNIRTGNEKIYTIIGCGGDRDNAKRPLMARIAVSLSDMAILTSDNPRSESPEAIIEEMKGGVEISLRSKMLCVTDRKEAIKMACALATKGDIILLAGKGHEKTQEIAGVKHPFDDKSILKDFLIQMNK